MMASFVPDPGGIFSSDAHRHVLGHMSTPDDEYGWEGSALKTRVVPSVGAQDVDAILDEVEADGLAEQVNGAWRLTEKGFDLLTGPIADEPGPNDGVINPAVITRATPIAKVS